MSDFPDCPCSGGTLDKLIQPAILAVLSAGPSHGYRIAETIGAIPNFLGERPDVSGIYRFLKNMESKGLVVSTWDAPGKGHAKRLYEITASGEACLAQWVETLDSYLTTINGLLTTARTAISRASRGKPCCGDCSPKRGRRPATVR